MPVVGRFEGIDSYLDTIWLINLSKIYPHNQPENIADTYNHTQKHNMVKPADSISSQSTDTNKSAYSSSYHLSKDKSGVERGYAMLIDTLRNIISKFNQLNIKNTDLQNVKSTLISKLYSSLKEINDEKYFAFTNMSWDKLVIGFFGETNAGKSTIIESLRILLNETTRAKSLKTGKKTDGEIVGDGRQDFTQDYNEYNLIIDNQPFVLIDVPGIEGKENLYKGKIGEALRKAHTIFYVNGHNKGLDKGTASKIQEFMGDGVKVNVIQNVRGNADNFEFLEDRQTFLTEGVKTVLLDLNSKFRSLLGNKYGQSIPVQGMLAMCAYADFSPSRPDLKKKQDRLLSYFGKDCGGNDVQTRAGILKFSNINEVISLIKERAHNFKSEIADANFIKLEQFCSASLKKYIAIVEQDRSKFESYQRQVSRFKSANLEEVQTYSTQFERNAIVEVTKILKDFSRSANGIIERGSYSSLDTLYKEKRKEIELKVKETGVSYSKELLKSVNSRVSNLKEIPGFSIIGNSLLSDFNMNINFDVDRVRNEDSITFGDIATSVRSTVAGASTGAVVGGILGTLIPIPGLGSVLGAWIGGSIGGGTGFVKGNIKAGENQTQRAKEEAARLIKSARQKYEKAISEKAIEFRQSAKSYILDLNHQADLRIKEIDSFYQCTSEAEATLKNALTKIKNYG